MQKYVASQCFDFSPDRIVQYNIVMIPYYAYEMKFKSKYWLQTAATALHTSHQNQNNQCDALTGCRSIQMLFFFFFFGFAVVQ